MASYSSSTVSLFEARMLLRTYHFLLVFFCSVYAQDLSIPTTWRKPTSNLPQENRLNLTHSLIDAFTPQYNNITGKIDALTLEQNAYILSAIASFDRLSNNTDPTNQLSVIQRFRLVQYFSGNLWQEPSWGLAAVSAYREYSDPYFLDVADTVWTVYSNFMITASDVFDGGKGHFGDGVVNIHECLGVPVTGGVLYNTSEVKEIEYGSVGALLSLSARLYEITGKAQYASVANATSEFVLNFIGDQPNINRMDIQTCSTLATTGLLVQKGYALAIEGLSVYAAVTKNDTLTQHLQKMILNVINVWRSGDGIYDGSTGGAADENIDQAYAGGPLMNALFEAWSSFPVDSDLSRLISSFMTVQFNAVVDFARLPDGTNYSPFWHPPALVHQGSLPWGQLQALFVLNTAVGMATTNQTQDSVSSSSSTAPQQTSNGSPLPQAAHTKQHLSSGTIAGVAAGGVIIIALLIAIPLLLSRRRSKRKNTKDVDILDSLETANYGEQLTFSTATPAHFPAIPNVTPFPLEKGGHVVITYATSSDPSARENIISNTTSQPIASTSRPRDSVQNYDDQPPQYEPLYDRADR
ncbi:hypothetical protein QCA50_004258 [Cerrena zonata]|uniref:Glycoside hydrolase family 76 protein n=1 Tax=Cerrena zonata TaxID=2478898 RepID=A0AAW0GH86_9APHY